MPSIAERPDVALAPDPLVPRPFRVLDRRIECEGTVTLSLEPVDGEPLRFAAGQFTMLGAFGVGEVPISISGDPTRPERLVHTIRDVGGVTRALAAAEPGAVLTVRGPFGVGWGVQDGAGGDVLLVAGGIGLAPLRPALLAVLADRASYGRVAVCYGARRPPDLLFGDEVEAWREHDVQVERTVDAGDAGWQGRVGLVTALIPRAGVEPARTLGLVCGPELMMRFSAAALVDAGVPDERVRLSLERNMKCGVGLCGHCQLREFLVCVDGPVLPYTTVERLITTREL